MKGLRGLWILGILWGVAQASEASLREQLNDLKARVAALEAAKEASPSEEPAPLTSMKQKAAIRIGGDVAVDAVVVRRDDLGRTSGNRDKIDSTRVQTGEADLVLDVVPSATTLLRLTLDLDDLSNGVDEDDILKECYFLWKNVLASSWSILFGKKEVDYGMARNLGIPGKSKGITESLHKGRAGWFKGIEADGDRDGYGNPYDTVGSNVLPSRPEDRFQVEGIWDWRDLMKAYLTVFQNDRLQHEDRPSDTGIESFAGKLEFSPLYALTLQASLLHQHSDRHGDEEIFGKNIAVDSQTAFSFGWEYRMQSRPLTLFFEYQHGIDTDYHEPSKTNVWQLGFLYGLSDHLDLGFMAEWAHIDEAIQIRKDGLRIGWDDQNYKQFVFNGTYHFAKGIYLTLEYAYTHFDGVLGCNTGMTPDGNTGSGHRVYRSASMWGVRTGWIF